LKKREEMRSERAAENDATETLGEAGATPPFDARCVTALWGRSRLADTCKPAGFFFTTGQNSVLLFLAGCSLVSEGFHGLQDFQASRLSKGERGMKDTVHASVHRSVHTAGERKC